MKSKIVSSVILYPLAALSVYGNVELFGGAQASLGWWFMLTAAIGLELGLLTLIASAARSRNIAALTLSVLLMVVSLSGQYAFLLTQANGHEATIAQARTEQNTGSEEATALRSEIATMSASLAAESKTGWGSKCKDLAARIDAAKQRLDGLSAQTKEAQKVEAHASPLLVLCARFNLPEAVTLNIAAGVMLLALNAAGFMLLYMSSSAAPQKAPAAAPEAPAPIEAPEPAPFRAAVRVSVPAELPRFNPAEGFAPAPEWLQQSRLNIIKKCKR